MYDAIRGNGDGAIAYFVALYVVGNCVILNLFLAILMSTFEESQQQVEQAEGMAARKEERAVASLSVFEKTLKGVRAQQQSLAEQSVESPVSSPKRSLLSRSMSVANQASDGVKRLRHQRRTQTENCRRSSSPKPSPSANASDQADVPNPRDTALALPELASGKRRLSEVDRSSKDPCTVGDGNDYTAPLPSALLGNEELAVESADSTRRRTSGHSPGRPAGDSCEAERLRQSVPATAVGERVYARPLRHTQQLLSHTTATAAAAAAAAAAVTSRGAAHVAHAGGKTAQLALASGGSEVDLDQAIDKFASEVHARVGEHIQHAKHHTVRTVQTAREVARAAHGAVTVLGTRAEAHVPSQVVAPVKATRKTVRWVQTGSVSGGRRIAQRVVAHRAFDPTIMLCILISSVAMVLDNPLADPASTLAQVLYTSNLVFTTIFFLEMIVKMIAVGLCAYIRSPWNQLDFVVVLVSVMDVAAAYLGTASGSILAAVKTIRILRALRPLRLINRNPNLKLVVDTLLGALPALGIFVCVCVIFFLLFGMFAVSRFKGGFWHCVDNDLESFGLARNVSACIAALPCFAAGQESAAPYVVDVTRALCPSALSELRLILPCDSPRLAEATFVEPVSGTSVCQDEWYQAMPCALCEAVWGADSCLEHFEDGARCLQHGGHWIRQNRNFDSVRFAMMTLFEISTTEGWIDVMHSAADSRGVDKVPARDEQKLLAVVFFVAFMMVGCLGMLNLCIGVIVDKFNELKRDKEGSIWATDAQKKWSAARDRCYRARLFKGLTELEKLPSSRKVVYFFVNNKHFERFIQVCIVLNTVVMGLHHVPSPAGFGWALSQLNLAFFVVFSLEVVLKLFALRGVYFWDSWNCFDFFCVVSTAVGLVYGLVSANGSFSSRVIGVLRTLRLFRLVRFSRGLRHIFTAFLVSIPKLANVCGILILLLFVFAVLGMQLFATSAALDPYGEHVHFRTFGAAVITLIRCLTGEAWNDIMHSLSKDKKFFLGVLHRPCVEKMQLDNVTQYQMWKDAGMIDDPIECGNSASFVYFTCYTMVVTLICLNLFIAVILEGFDDGGRTETEDLLERCVLMWLEADSQHTMSMPLPEGIAFIHRCVDVVFRDANQIMSSSSYLSSSPRETGLSPEDLTHLSMRWCSALSIRVTPLGDLQFAQAILGAMRAIAARNDTLVMAALRQVDEKHDRSSTPRCAPDMKTMLIGEHEMRSWGGSGAVQPATARTLVNALGSMKKLLVGTSAEVALNDPNMLPLEYFVGALKLQRAFRSRRDYQLQQQRESAEKRAAEERNRRMMPPVAG